MSAVSHAGQAQRYSGNLSALSLDTEYRSLKDSPVEHFYVPCLREAAQYRRAVGYFRSTVLLVIGPALIDFARRGGKIDLICSPALDVQDAENIAYGYRRRGEDVATALIAEFDAMLADVRSAHAARALATLVAAGSLDIRLAERKDGRGIYHEKLGVFQDGLSNRVSFKGSTNETWSGWHSAGNFESIEVFCSWRGGLEAERVAKHDRHFASLWSGKDPHVDVFDIPSRVTDYVKRFSAKGLDELTLEKQVLEVPRRSALPHQDAAIAAWIRQGRRGIFEHATGSGKTYTALLAIRDHVQQGRPALVLVPSRLLLGQWAQEIADEIPDAALLLAGAGHDRWKGTRRLQSMTADDTALGPRITLSTMATAASEEFRRMVQAGPQLLIVADEVHQVGSAQNAKVFELDAGSRLGLSATPKRFGDPDGTQRLFEYFGAVVEPRITLADAIKADRLVQYEYYPHPVHLTASEAEEWAVQTRAIKLEIARQKDDGQGRKPLSERAKMMLIRRSRIAKKASAKVRLAVDVLKQHYEHGQSWLVYCEDGGQLADVLVALREEGFAPVEYHSDMAGDRAATMTWFRSFGGILVSIRCLDEGVDIPAVSHALILASSQNPRQFIQRRGRVLRRSPGKALAYIHDAIVVPTDAEDDKDQLGLLEAEMIRSVEFARNAINQSAGAELRDMSMSLGLDPDRFDHDQGDEDEE